MDWHKIFDLLLKIWDYPARLWQGPLRAVDWLVEWFSRGIILLVTAILGLFPGIDPYVVGQIPASVALAPWAVLSSPLRRQQSEEAVAAMEKVGGFMRGICHAGGNYGQLLENNIEWERLDAPFPYEADGETPSQGWLAFKQDVIERSAAGLKTMMVTPNPGTYLENGVDPRTPEGLDKVAKTAVFMLEDLKPYIGAAQFGNEIGIKRFMHPLTTEEGARFLIAQFEAAYPVKGDVLVGYNTGGPQLDLNRLMKPHMQYVDFYGLDMYLGCFFGFPSYMWIFDLLVEAMWSYLQTPIVMTEFGYLGAGAPKTRAEKDQLLQEQFGYANEEAVKADPEGFLEALEAYSPKMAEYARVHGEGNMANYLFSLEFAPHIYREVKEDYVIPGFPHTPEGHAKFYADVIPRLAKYPFVIGEFIYSWKDSERCYVCYQPDCPIETSWGLLYADGSPKPSLAVVREAYGKLK